MQSGARMATHQAAPIYGAVEAGGTKFVCAVGAGKSAELVARQEFPTGDDPPECMARVVGWLQAQQAEHGLFAGIGVATFGPVDLNLESPMYGHITTTPKPGWAGADLLGPLRRTFADLPLAIDTDVNGAALGECAWGAAQGLTDFIYVTMGTGIGGGGMVGGQLIHGLIHPEMGHVRLPRLTGDDFPGACPYHGDCWEGLCCGPAIEKRVGRPAEDLPADDPAWRITAHYTALALANILFVTSPQRMIVGGSVRKAGRFGQSAFLQVVRERLQEILNHYIVSPAVEAQGIDDFVVPPLLGDDAGICGAIALAHRASR
jgi:fructokinase